MHMTTLKNIMTTNLTTVNENTSLQEAAQLMRQNNIGNVLVMNGEELRGIVTDRDIVIRAVAEGQNSNATVRECATHDVYTMSCDTSVEEAAQAMASRQLRRLPVTENNKVVGIVALGDLAIRAAGNADQKALEGISEGIKPQQ